MKKVILTFPDPNSLWLFKDKSRAINVAVAPMKNTITGLFSVEEVSIAIKDFQAVLVNTSTDTSSYLIRHTETRNVKPTFRYWFSQLLAMMNL